MTIHSDDTNVLAAVKYMHNVKQKTENNFRQISEWFTGNALLLNLEKIN